MDLGYIKVTNKITGGYALFKSEADNKGQLSFEQPYLEGDTYKVQIQGVNASGGAIPQQTIEIEVPQDEIPVSGYFYWGNILRYIAKAAKKKLCPKCT